MSQVTGIYPAGGVEAEQEKVSKKRENLFIADLKLIPKGFEKLANGASKIIKGEVDTAVNFFSTFGYALATAASAVFLGANKISGNDEKADQNREKMHNRAAKTKEHAVKTGKGFGSIATGTAEAIVGIGQGVVGVYGVAPTAVIGAVQAIGGGIARKIEKKKQAAEQAQAAESQPTEQQKTDPQQRTM